MTQIWPPGSVLEIDSKVLNEKILLVPDDYEATGQEQLVIYRRSEIEALSKLKGRTAVLTDVHAFKKGLPCTVSGVQVSDETSRVARLNAIRNIRTALKETP